MLEDRVVEIAVGLLRQQTARDSQKLVGASQISDPCTRHLARALVVSGEAPQKYWLGARIGTAVHMLLEDAVTKADLDEFPELEGALIEQKIELGDVPGYGLVTSKPDLMLVKANHLIDWKTSKRDKMRKLSRYIDSLRNGEDSKDTDSAYTLQKYVAQVQLYAWGLTRAGHEVKDCTLVFVNRDGTNENDVWSYQFEYSEEFALAVWSRFINLWSEIEAGLDIDAIEPTSGCFKCDIGI